MSNEIAGDATQFVGQDGGPLGRGGGDATGSMTQLVPRSGVDFAGGPGSIGGTATIERWLFSSTDDDDNGSEGGPNEMRARTLYDVTAYRDGHAIWRDLFENLVMIAGYDALLEATFKGSGYTAAWFVGLIEGPGASFDSGDTMASHAGWDESIIIDEIARPAFVPGTVAGGSVDNVDSRAVFTMSEAGSVGGFFLTDDDEISGATGVLYGAGEFSGGVRAVEEGDILRVAATLILENA